MAPAGALIQHRARSARSSYATLFVFFSRRNRVKTKDFESNAEVAALVEAFETATIPSSEFKHAAHIAVALSYLAKLPPNEALARMREKLRHFAAVHHVDNLYHETLTTFWMRLLDHAARTYNVDPPRRRSPQRPKADLPLWRRINLIVARWGTSAPVVAHYSRELIASKGARETWVPPDRLPLPF
jgi:hypothetical protein